MSDSTPNESAADGQTPDAARGAPATRVCRWHFYAGLFVAPFMVMLSERESSTSSNRNSTA